MMMGEFSTIRDFFSSPKKQSFVRAKQQKWPRNVAHFKMILESTLEDFGLYFSLRYEALQSFLQRYMVDFPVNWFSLLRLIE